MARKKKEVTPEPEYQEISKDYADEYCQAAIPEGATHYKLEVDTSGCYYEGDMPSYVIHFYKKKEG